MFNSSDQLQKLNYLLKLLMMQKNSQKQFLSAKMIPMSAHLKTSVK